MKVKCSFKLLKFHFISNPSIFQIHTLSWPLPGLCLGDPILLTRPEIAIQFNKSLITYLTQRACSFLCTDIY